MADYDDGYERTIMKKGLERETASRQELENRYAFHIDDYGEQAAQSTAGATTTSSKQTSNNNDVNGQVLILLRHALKLLEQEQQKHSG